MQPRYMNAHCPVYGMKVQYGPGKEAIEKPDIVRGGYLEKDGKLRTVDQRRCDSALP
jgi:hypothetical protein